MARQPSNWNQYLVAAQSEITGPPFTISVWIRPSYLAQKRRFTSIYRTSDNRWWVLWMDSNSPYKIRLDVNGYTAPIFTTTGVSSGTWHHCCAVVVSATERYVYLDGGNKGGGSGLSSRTITSLNRYSLGFPFGDSFDGDIAELAFYKAALADEEVDRLSKVSPLHVRPNDLAEYFRLIRPPDNGIISGRVFGGGATINTTPHCRVFYITPPSSSCGLAPAMASDSYGPKIQVI